jgi:hypothetical protein
MPASKNFFIAWTLNPSRFGIALAGYIIKRRCIAGAAIRASGKPTCIRPASATGIRPKSSSSSSAASTPTAEGPLNYFADFQNPGADQTAFGDLLNYMSVQKLRTPKGLAQLAQMTGERNRNELLLRMQRLQDIVFEAAKKGVRRIARDLKVGVGTVLRLKAA